MKLKKQTGSVLILVLIAVLIISLLGIMGLDQTATEVAISRNFTADKTALYCAESGIQTGIHQLRNTVDPLSVKVEFTESGPNLSRAFQSADIKSGKITDSAAQYVTGFSTFQAPKPRGMSIEVGGEAGITPTAWQLTVSSFLRNWSRGQARKQINTAVVLLSSEY